jgi:hypothetical protein
MSEKKSDIKIEKNDKSKRQVDKRSFILKMFSVGSVIAIIAILIVFNLLFESLLGSVLSWDLTGTQNNSIGDVSKGILSTLSKDVEIVGLFELTPDNEKLYKDFIPLLEDYSRESAGKIKVRYVDPQKYPSIVKELDPNKTTTLSQGYFVIKSGDKLRVINPEDCYIMDEEAYYTTGQYVFSSNSIELNFTGAINSVTSGEAFKVYFTSSHQESSHTQLNTLLGNNGFEIADLETISLDAIPDDCSLLIMQTPQLDISATDVKLFTDYLEKGGRMIVITDYSSQSLSFPNLNQVMNTMNLSISDSLISENDMNYRIQATSGYGSFANISAGTFSPDGADHALLVAYGRGINAFDNPKPYITTESIITTSAKGVLEENGDPEISSIEGVKNIAMYSRNEYGAVPAEVVIIGTSYLTSDAFIENYSLNDQNVVFFSSIVKKLVGIENNIQIPVKEYPNFTLATKPSANTQTVISIFIIGIIPLSLVVAAVVIYRKRKHL